jgi:ascorbate-specific PTS system EIIC-type component UlaA
MTMEAQPTNDGRSRLSLGPVEKWIVGAFASGVVIGVVWLVGSVQTMLTQQQVTNQQVMTVQQQVQAISVQLADVPALKLELAKQSIKIEQHDQELRELRQLRGLK